MRVYTSIIRSGKSSYPGVAKIAFVFHFNAEEIEWEHVTRLGALFPILDEAVHFAHFSYDVRTLTPVSSVQEYSSFVREQIQNQLQYGVHLPFPSYKLLGTWIGTCLLAILSLFMVAQFNEENPFLYLFGLIFVALVFKQGHELLCYYRAKHQLDKYRK